MADFTANGKSYDVEFSIERIQLYEDDGRPPILMTVYRYDGMLPVSDLLGLLSYGLKLEGGEYVNPEDGLAMATSLVQQNGYGPCLNVVLDALKRDCGFFFVRDSQS